MRRILIAAEGASCSIEAIQQFAKMFNPQNLTVFILAVLRPENRPITLFPHARFQRWESEEAMVALDRASATLAREGYTSFSVIRIGDPAESILQVAQELETDLIVLATEARQGIKRMVRSSVAESVLLEAPCSVMVNPFDEATPHAPEDHPAA